MPTRQLTLTTVPTITPVVLSQLARILDRRTVLWLTAILAVCASRPWDAQWSTTPFGLLNTALPTALSLYFEARRQLLKSLRDRAERAPAVPGVVSGKSCSNPLYHSRLTAGPAPEGGAAFTVAFRLG